MNKRDELDRKFIINAIEKYKFLTLLKVLIFLTGCNSVYIYTKKLLSFVYLLRISHGLVTELVMNLL